MTPAPLKTAANRPGSPPGATVAPRRGWRRAYVLGRDTVVAYFNDRVPTLGAALAFYTTIAVTPLLMLVLALAGAVFEESAARQRILGEITNLAGIDPTRALGAIRPPAHLASTTAWVSIAVFMAGGFGVFSHLQDALNTIWRAPQRTGDPWIVTLKRRLLSFGTVVATGFIMMVSLVLSAGLAWIAEHASQWERWPALVSEGANFAVSLGITTVLFAMMFKILPDVRIRWRDVWIGAAFTAFFFDFGKTALGFYFAHSSVASAYGAAGSAIALLLWCYYAAQIAFFGAELTRVYAITRGGRFDPPPGADTFPDA